MQSFDERNHQFFSREAWNFDNNRMPVSYGVSTDSDNRKLIAFFEIEPQYRREGGRKDTVIRSRINQRPGLEMAVVNKIAVTDIQERPRLVAWPKGSKRLILDRHPKRRTSARLSWARKSAPAPDNQLF